MAALCEASIQVLLAVGYRRLTNTRVAERAGVSVGTLYQYFQNRESLITLVIERYLNEFGSLVEQKCQALIGRPLDHAVTGLVNALIESKWKRIEVARALHEPLGEVNGAKLVTRFAGKATRLVVEILKACPDVRIRDVEVGAQFIVLACNSLLQAALTDNTGTLDTKKLGAHMRSMVLGYLRERMRPDGKTKSSSIGRGRAAGRRTIVGVRQRTDERTSRG